MTNKYEIFLRDNTGQRIGQLEAFESLAFVRRFNLLGSWALTSKPDALALLDRQGGIEIYRNGSLYFSGAVSDFEDVNGLQMVANGYSDEDFVAGRVALPVPAGPPYTVDYDVRSGLAEGVIKDYINLNAGPGATPARQVAGLSVETDFARGSTVTGRARFDNLLTLANSLAIQGGLGFRVLDLQFQIYVPGDKSERIIFSKELGTLGSYDFKVKRGKANFVTVGGAGTGSARTFIEMADSESVIEWGRREEFIDKSSTSSADELSAAAAEELEKSADEISLSFQPIITEGMTPVDDYDVGDWVAAVIKGETIVQQVREIKTTLDVSGAEVIEMAIGTDGATTDMTGLAKVYSRIKAIDQRVNTMERR